MLGYYLKEGWRDMINFTRIGIDLSLACSDSPRGIGVYEKNIGLPSDDFIKNNTVVVFGVGIKPKWINSDVRYINIFISNPIIREQILLPFFSLLLNLDQLHVFANVAPFFLKLKPSCKIYLTIHDVSYKYSRGYMKNDKNQNTIKRYIGLLYQSLLFNYSCKRAKKIFTVSNWSTKELLRYAKHDIKSKISIIPNICDNVFIDREKSEWNNRENRIILVTGAHPQKNLIFFLECFIELIKDIKSDIKVDIVGVGRAEMESKYLSIERVKFHGKVPQLNLIDLYDNSKILVVPSLFESFSIPLIEAKYRGLYILSSDGGATKEVASSYAVFFNPNNKVDFKNKLLDLLSNIDTPPKYDKCKQININNLYWMQND
jgi:hypothetical protein